MLKFFTALAASSLVLTGSGPAASNQAETAPAAERFQLRVSLFAWIPENEQFARWIETSFEERYGDIDLIIRPMERAAVDDQDLSYDLEATKAALLDETSTDHQHLVEIDTVILGNLVDAEAVQPFRAARSDFFRFANEAVTVNRTIYGVPHWTCGYFIMTTHRNVAAARSAADLRRRLEGLGTNSPDLGGSLDTSWNSVAVYLDAYADTYPRRNPAEALGGAPPDTRMGAALDDFGAACTGSGGAFCNRGQDEMERVFARGGLDALVGYSERLNFVFQQADNVLRPADVRITPAPIGGGSHSLFFTDALVQSVRCNSVRCRDAARRFAEFYVSNAVLVAAIMGHDGRGGTRPRYLLPSTRGAMAASVVQRDPIYRQLTSLMARARPYPNRGIPEARAAGLIRQEVRARVHTPR